jgi:hypothetical protein
VLVFRRTSLGARADTVAYLIESGFALNGLFGEALLGVLVSIVVCCIVSPSGFKVCKVLERKDIGLDFGVWSLCLWVKEESPTGWPGSSLFSLI